MNWPHKCPTGQCRKGARCMTCMERDRLAQQPAQNDTMTTQNSSSVLRTLFGLRGRRR